MKKILSLLVVAGMVFVASCGQSAKQKEAEQKRIQDSIRVADSIAQVEKAAQAADQAKQDSIANAAKQDSIAKAEEANKKPAKPAKKGK